MIVGFLLGIVTGVTLLICYLVYSHSKFNKIITRSPFSTNCEDNNVYLASKTPTYRSHSGMLLGTDNCSSFQTKEAKTKTLSHDNGLYDQISQFQQDIEETHLYIEQMQAKMHKTETVKRPPPPAGGKLKSISQ